MIRSLKLNIFWQKLKVIYRRFCDRNLFYYLEYCIRLLLSFWTSGHMILYSHRNEPAFNMLGEERINSTLLPNSVLYSKLTFTIGNDNNIHIV